ncbi:hypothetical protein [Clostridium facile]|uniref:Uncharacterized protein n=1 Tax=Clostridium facile TaxID=2763035 RepID=A0ABR7INT0_9CLOT|nr:hypothetical protein [Clostridium facile]MBC5786771.1 hypothetical protein [Clostridium facile]
MLKEFTEKIIALAKPNEVEKFGCTYTDKRLDLMEEPHMSPISFSSLIGLVQALKTDQIFERTPFMVRVTSPTCVDVFSAANGSDKSRASIYNVNAIIPSMPFGQFMDYESMMINLKSKFVQTNEVLERIQLLGTITEENSSSVSDDGFTQNVVVKQGIALKGNKAIDPITRLKPYRTFLEVDQPESDFLLRLQEGRRVALFEADGGAWKLQAKQNIKEYLERELANEIEQGLLFVVE